MRRVLLGLSVVVGILAALHVPSDAYPGAPWFEPGTVYRANFPDPSVIRVGDTYYVYATSTGGSMLPVMSSTDLVNWTARPAYNPNPYNSDPFLNDGLVDKPEWGLPIGGHPWITRDIEAPGIAQIGGNYVAFYAVAVTPNPGYSERYCLSFATSSSPLGPFVDETAGAFFCDTDPVGSRDPQPFVDPVSGDPYLVWKSEGVPGSTDPRIWIRELNSTGTGWASGSSRTLLIDGYSVPWEGQVVENPAMVRWNGSYWLFYSGNEWESSNYAMGYAKCTTVLGPCTKSAANPILRSGTGLNGPGGGSPFVDSAGQLQLGYHAWNSPYTSYPEYPACVGSDTCTTRGQRRLYIEPVWLLSNGKLQVGGCPGPGPFTDVSSTHPFCYQIDWMKDEGYSTGKADGSFGSTDDLSRGALAAFLYRYSGSPPGPFTSDFSDVPPDHPFYEEISWMAEEGITGGYSDGTFRPTGVVARQSVAAFLYRLAGEPEVTAPDPGFKDVGFSHPFYDEIRWLAASGITSGYADGTFKPANRVLRQSVAAFLYRYDLLVDV